MFTVLGHKFRNVPTNVHGTEFSKYVAEELNKICEGLPLNLSMTHLDIDCSHILYNEYEGRKRFPVIVIKFVNRDLRNAIFNYRNVLNRNGTIISEHLTVDNRKLLDNARKHPRVEDAWSQQCKIYAVIDGDKSVIDIDTDLSTFIPDVPSPRAEPDLNVQGPPIAGSVDYLELHNPTAPAGPRYQQSNRNTRRKNFYRGRKAGTGYYQPNRKKWSNDYRRKSAGRTNSNANNSSNRSNSDRPHHQQYSNATIHSNQQSPSNQVQPNQANIPHNTVNNHTNPNVNTQLPHVPASNWCNTNLPPCNQSSNGFPQPPAHPNNVGPSPPNWNCHYSHHYANNTLHNNIHTQGPQNGSNYINAIHPNSNNMNNGSNFASYRPC